MFATVFVFNPLAQGAAEILLLLTGKRSTKVLRRIRNAFSSFSSDDTDDDSDYRDPTIEELLEWMFADPNSRPEDQEYGD